MLWWITGILKKFSVCTFLLRLSFCVWYHSSLWFALTVTTCISGVHVLATGVAELGAGWIMLRSDITLWEQHNDLYQSLYCQVTLVKYHGGVLAKGEGDCRETSSTTVAWQCINHRNGTLSVSRLKLSWYKHEPMEMLSLHGGGREG